MPRILLHGPSGALKERRIWRGVVLALLAAAALLLLCSLRRRPSGQWVSVEREGVQVARLSLQDFVCVAVRSDGTLTTTDLSATSVVSWAELARQEGATHVFTVSPEGVQMRYADCPDQICVHQGLQTQAGSSVVCLPGRLILRLESTEEPDPDAVDTFVR